MQEDLIFNVIYKIWYDTSPVNRSARVCLNRDDVNSANKLQSTRLHLVVFCSFLNSPCFQYNLRNKRLSFWEIPICLNFTFLTRNDEKIRFLTLKTGDGLICEFDLYTSKNGNSVLYRHYGTLLHSKYCVSSN